MVQSEDGGVTLGSKASIIDSQDVELDNVAVKVCMLVPALVVVPPCSAVLLLPEIDAALGGVGHEGLLIVIALFTQATVAMFISPATAAVLFAGTETAVPVEEGALA